MNDIYQYYIKSLNFPDHPVLFLDQQAFNKNCLWMVKNVGSKKIRIATKSIRSRAILSKILSMNSVFQGLMTFDLREALWLKSQGFKDILMGYPTMDKISLAQLAKDPTGIILMADLPEHLEILNKTAKEHSTKFEICVDVDMSMDLPGLRFGVYRSKINSESQMEKFLLKLKSCTHLKLTGLMGYEAQIAGVMDKESLLIRALKKISLRQLQKRRLKLVEMIHAEGHTLSFINGGGTGSLLETSTEGVVSEITVGSGFYAPVLFDYYHHFKLNPSLLFTLPIVRHPSENIFTCLGGGYIASGTLEKLKQPTPYLPMGMTLLKHEGAGEVQTPFKYKGELKLKVGDAIIMRHAKAGEICERFQDILIVSNGTISEVVKTYRGEGKTFI